LLSKWGLWSGIFPYFCRLNLKPMRIIYSFLLLLVTLFTNAQTNVSWDFTTATPSAGVPVSNLTISAVSQGNNNGTTVLLTTTSVSSGYAGASGTFNAGAAAIIGALNTVASGSAYFEFTLTPAAGYTVNLSALNFGTRATATGPQAYSVKTSFNSFGADIATGTIANNSTWSLKTNTTAVTSASGTPLVVRIYGYGGAGSPSAGTANWRIDDLFLTLTVTSSGADITPPLATTFTPADDAINVSSSTNLSILFNEAIQKGAGNILIKKLSDNSIVQTIDVTTAAVVVAGSTATISINPLALATAFYVEIDATAIKDIANNNYAGITGNSTWNFTTGTSIFVADFNTCTTALANGFTQYNATGPQVWACTTFGHGTTPTGSAPNGVQINGFASGSNVINEDWLISPSLNLVATTYPLLSFWSRTAFNGAPLKLKVSTNYTGTGDPALATWTDLTGNFPLLATDVWTLSQNINLAAFKTANTYIAFVYNSTLDDGARWTLDDVKIDNSLTPPPATLTPNTGEVNFGYVASGSTLVKTINFTGNDITGGVTLTATGNYLISKTNGSFTPSISYTQAEANNINKIVFIQFAPTAPTVSYSGTLTISTPTVADTILILKGNSIDAATTLEVVNWNIEWFGSTTLGPTNDNLQEQNIKTVLQNVGADVYALEEVVSEPRLANIVSQMPGYSYVLSNYGSYTNPNQAGAGTLADAQKLGMIYKTALFPGGLTTQALLSAGINTAADVTNPAYNWYASGRFPFMVTGTTTLNGVTKQIRFVITHAKANTSPTLTSYARRKAGNDSLLIHLNTFYPNDNIIFLGDFNDDLDSTITAGINPKLSSYKQFTDDAANFYSPTLALSLAGKKSTVSYNDVIDHVMLSNEMKCSYMAGSAAILTDVAGLIPNYGTTTTDHYPVFSRYLFVQPQAATLSYSGSPYCSSAGTANATFTGTTGGIYSSTVGLSINGTTGAINLTASTAGTYVVTYTLAANGVCNPLFTTTANVSITAAPSATIAYAGSPYCSSIAATTVTRTGTTGGVYSSTIGLSINATTGDVNIATSTTGTYTVTYTVAAAGGCALFTTTTSITITAAPAATITYGATPYCSNGGTANVTRTGTTSGVYSSTAGLSINATTGAVTLATSTAGTYTVTYTVGAAGGCAIFTTTAPITITAAANATINYAGSPYCQAATIAAVTRTGNAGGVYTSTTGLVINATTGDVDVAASTAGTYVVTYTIAANTGCTIFTTTTNITINSISVIPTSASSNTTLICANSGTVTLTANGGTLGAGASYKWYSGTCGGTLVGTGAILNNVPLNTTTTYFVRIEGTCNTTACQSVTVNVAPQPVVEITVAPATGIAPAAPVTIIATVSPAGNYSYIWTKNNSINLTTNADRIVVSADEAGNYKVKVTAASGCTATSTNAFVSSAASAKLFISANPNRGVFNVSYNDGAANLTARTLNIYDSKGARVFTQNYNNNVPFSNMKVDISSKGKGTYFVELIDATGKKLADGKVQVL
jgi:Bacterial Ig-like domain/Ig-like domain CHU_C associated/Secretion system C-terminal sorting domain